MYGFGRRPRPGAAARIGLMGSLAVREQRRRTPVSELEFAGCTPVRASVAEIEGPEWEGRRLEYWHRETETAWRVEASVSPYHEGPAARLVALVRQICMARGSGAEYFGNMDLRFREDEGTLGDIMQADQTVYLHPGRARLPGPAHLIVGEDDFPDVVLEVDHTTDVRRGKLVANEEWGFPEVWVETPDREAPSRPRSLRPGLRIHLLEAGRYVESEASRAFPGWRAEEIHRALNEFALSAETEADLWRVGRALGEREGTAPEDDALMRRMEQRGHARGMAAGHARGMAAGHARGMAAAVIRMLRRRGIEVSPSRVATLIADTSADRVVEAALAADSEADFLARLGG